MNYTEYLKSKNITVQTSARQLKKMLEAYKKDASSFTKAFGQVKIKQDNKDIEPSDFLATALDWKESISEFDNTVKTNYDMLVNLFESVIKTKETNKEIVKEHKVKETLEVPDYANKGYEYKDVNLFETVLNCKPNEHDRELYKNFVIVGEQVAYSHNDSITLINTDLKNERLEIGLSDYSKDDSLYDMICKDLAPLYERYMNTLKKELAQIDTESLESSIEEGNYGVIEDIFLKKIPTSFRHIVKIKSCWKKTESMTFLDKFVAKPLKAYGEMNTLEFTEFLNFLTSHFKKMTAGCLEKQDHYYNWSNDFKHKSVSTWLLPTEEEWKKATLPACWDKFLTPKASPRLMQRVYYYLGAIQDAHNYAQQALVISDEGQTGKGTLTRLLKDILPKKAFGFVVNSAFSDSNQFGLSNNNVYDNHIVCISEYDGNSLCSNKGKAAIGGDVLTLDVKNRHSVEWNTYGTKFLITSNEGCALKEHSYRRRFIPVTFKQTHCMKDNFTDSELDELRKEGRNFLNYCYKIYKTCPLGTKSGEYLVMCPEHEEYYLKNGTLPCDDKERLIKAFVKDTEITEYFYVGDYSDSEETLDFECMLNNICTVTGNDADEIESAEMKKLIIDYCKNNKMHSLFGLKKIGIDDYEIPTTGKGTQWWKFLQYIKATDVKFVTKGASGSRKKVFTGCKLNTNYNTATTFMNRLSNTTTNDEQNSVCAKNDTASFIAYHQIVREATPNEPVDEDVGDSDEFFKRLAEQN